LKEQKIQKLKTSYHVIFVSKMKIDLKDICNLSRVPISMSGNPYYLTVLQLLNKWDLEFNETFVFFYYKNFIPDTLGNFYGIKGKSLMETPADAVFFPWSHTEPATKYRNDKNYPRISGNPTT